jgi:hypothetical protein
MLPEGNEIKSLDVLSNFVLLNKSIPKNTKARSQKPCGQHTWGTISF